MIDIERLERDIKMLVQSIRIDSEELAFRRLSSEEKHKIKQHIQWCIDELRELVKRFS